MDDPAREIESVIQSLVSTPPSTQRQTIDTYFLPTASFTHPFCRTGSFNGSRALIHGIYRWYKIMSPRIDLTVHSVAHDKPSDTLYVHISQVFRVWAIPFYSAPVELVTVLKLYKDPSNSKYYIKSQDDLYQTSEFIKFVLPGLGPQLVLLWQFLATLVCLVLAWLFWPVTWVEEELGDKVQRNGLKGPVAELLNGAAGNTAERETKKARLDGVDNELRSFASLDGKDGLVTVPAVQRR